jgi:hypothetical protein
MKLYFWRKFLMDNNSLAKIINNYHKKTPNIKNINTADYKIYTPEIIQKYKDSYKIILKLTNNEDKAKFIMYKKVIKWFEKEKIINVSIEKIYIKSKLGSYTSGGCGLGASFFAGLIASGLFSYMDSYIKKLGPFFFVVYFILVLCFGIKILSDEDKKVEMYNMFLEALNNLDYDKNEKLG